MRQGRGVIGEGFDIEKNRARQVPCAIFSGNVTMLLARRGHARVDNLNFRVVAVLNQPVGGDKYEVDMVASILFRKKGLSVFFLTPTS